MFDSVFIRLLQRVLGIRGFKIIAFNFHEKDYKNI